MWVLQRTRTILARAAVSRRAQFTWWSRIRKKFVLDITGPKMSCSGPTAWKIIEFSEIWVFAQIFDFVPSREPHSFFSAFPCVSYSAYTVKSGEHAQSINFGHTHLKPCQNYPKSFLPNSILGHRNHVFPGVRSIRPVFRVQQHRFSLGHNFWDVNAEKRAEISTRAKMFFFLKPI
jgi:hypothetical protein